MMPGIPERRTHDYARHGIHKTPAIKAWLAARPRFHTHFTPTGSSWINQVERWFGFLPDQKIRRGAHKSVQALEADIRAWINGWNSNPRPFIWTETADVYLAAIAAGAAMTVALTGVVPRLARGEFSAMHKEPCLGLKQGFPLERGWARGHLDISPR
ncbi:transposase [Actinocorallia libanotica]|uniref:Tc1-like transposase DDE domain-containing protein n=1 Tax=Actinocorallia libanotica TaxID=46162 RepID=A0ABN1RT15_9ACTN